MSLQIDVEVLNVGGMMVKTKHVGSGKVELEELLALPNKEGDITVKLTHYVKKKAKKEKGIVQMHAKVVEDTPAEQEKKEEPKKEAEVEPKKDKEDISKKKNIAEKSNQPVKKPDPPLDEKDSDEKKGENGNNTVDKLNDVKNDSKEMKNSPEEKEEEEKKKKIDVSPFEFEKAVLFIHKISAKNMKSVEWFSKNVSTWRIRLLLVMYMFFII